MLYTENKKGYNTNENGEKLYPMCVYLADKVRACIEIYLAEQDTENADILTNALAALQACKEIYPSGYVWVEGCVYHAYNGVKERV